MTKRHSSGTPHETSGFEDDPEMERAYCSHPQRSATEERDPDADLALTEAMHVLGANEGENILSLAYRVKERLDFYRRELAKFTDKA